MNMWPFNVITSMTESVSGVFTRVGTTVSNTWRAISDTVTGVFKGAGKVGSSLVGAITNVVDGIGAGSANLIKTVSSAPSSIGDKISSMLSFGSIALVALGLGILYVVYTLVVKRDIGASFDPMTKKFEARVGQRNV